MTNLWAIEYKARNGRWVFLIDDWSSVNLPRLYKKENHALETIENIPFLINNPSARPVKVEIIKKEGKNE